MILDVTPVHVLAFERGRVEVMTVGGRAIGRGRYAPGWHWSHHAADGPAQLGTGPRDQVGVVVSGRARVRLPAGELIDLTPGDFFHITAEEDAWVVGYRPLTILYLSGVEELVREVRRRP